MPVRTPRPLSVRGYRLLLEPDVKSQVIIEESGNVRIPGVPDVMCVTADVDEACVRFPKSQPRRFIVVQ